MVVVVFFVYDVLVQSPRNAKLVANAARSNAIVTQLFPGKIRDQIIAQKQEEEEQLYKSKKGGKANFKSFVAEGVDGLSDINSKPLAELFLETTVMFAYIVGFTAWSSVRDPTQVFTLLETVFHTFDEIAKRRRIFKVETVGACYVAATGIPEPRRDHAIVMIRFAHDIVSRMSVITKKLEVSLGLDTGELSLRIGIHSGPVTAGVLRGERSRFQLFGDTMNTTARVESTSLPGRVQLSKDTAELVMKGGKGHWLEERKDRVSAKGKGEIETYWLKATFYQQNATRSTTGSIVGEYDTESNDQAGVVGDGEGSTTGSSAKKTARLIDWNVKTLLGLLEQVVAHRNALAAVGKKTVDTPDVFKESTRKTNANFLEEVKEIITLPEFDSKAAQHQQDSKGVKLSKEVENQLRNYVSCIAGMYRENPFHSFEHASHVLMSVIKVCVCKRESCNQYLYHHTISSRHNSSLGPLLSSCLASWRHRIWRRIARMRCTTTPTVSRRTP
jgi:class 3 adenylate cyclase